MSAAVKTFFSKITDEYDGEYPNAFAAIREWSESSQKTGGSIDCQGAYTLEADLEAIAYKLNYWYSEETRSKGKRSRPLLNDESGTFTDVFIVDMDNPKVIAALALNPGTIGATLEAIQIDVAQRNI